MKDHIELNDLFMDENKALIKTLEIFQIESELKFKSLEESMDELLEALKELMTKAELLINGFACGKAHKAYNSIIQKAKGLKDKETK